MRLTDDLEVAITRRSVGGGGGTPLFRDTALNTLFENHSKMSHLNFSLMVFFTDFYPFTIDLSGNTVKKLAILLHF